MKSFREEEVKLNNSLNVVKIPLNPARRYAVIGCRGWAEQGRYVENLHRHLDRLGEAIVAKGYFWGASDYGSGGYPLKKALKSVKMLISYMKEKYQIEKFVILGTSMGGHIALIYAIENPEDVCGVVDIYGVVDVEKQVRYIVKMLSMLPVAVFKIKELSALKAAFRFLVDVKEEFGGEPRLLKFTEEYARYSPLKRIGELKVPLLIIHGDKDQAVPLEFSRELVEKLRESGKNYLLYKFHIVKDYGHEEKTIEESIDVIYDFLEYCFKKC
ncbi:MAG: hypothetical protein DRJ38_02385 [Thermoprotei archaeon]|nr:MAG: hypothetical protein DRJ38_02385 [Thermoprotei archaeon]